MTAKQIVMGEKPSISAESEKLDPATLEEMCLNVGTLATVYLKPVQQVFRSARPRRLVESPALQRPPSGPKELARDESTPDALTNDQNRNGMTSPADVAEAYFSGLGSQRLAAMNIGEDGFGGSQTIGAPGERQYVVSQNHPQQVFQPQIGGGNGDLLLL